MSPGRLRTDSPPQAAVGAPVAGAPATAGPATREPDLTPRTPSVVLHQVRSPITAIIGFAETLARSAERGTLSPEKLIDRLGRIRDSAMRINCLVDELDHLPEQPPRLSK